MARPAKTKTHLENLVITPKTAHGDADGDTVFAIYPIDSDDINGTPTAVFSVNENGGITVSGTSLTGAENITSLVVADTSTTTGNSVAITSTAITTGDALEIFVDTDTVTTGKAINVISGANYGAATSKFSVDEDGDVIAGTITSGINGAGGTAGRLTINNGANPGSIVALIDATGGTSLYAPSATVDTLTVDAGLATAGNGLKIITDSDVQTTGQSLLIMGGSAALDEVFKVDSHGNTTVLGALGVNDAVTLRAGRVPLIKRTVTDYNAQTATLTIAGLLGGIVTQNSKTGPSTATTPTGTEISAGITGVAVGDSFSCLYYNRGNQTSTITAGASGVTVYGNTTVPALKTAELIFHCTAANTWSCYVVLSA